MKEKLVRDRIPFIITAQTGKSPNFRVIHSCDDLLPFVVEKIKEETNELLQAVDEYSKNIQNNDKKQIIEEIVDVQDIIDELMKVLRIDCYQVMNEKTSKNSTKGNFKESIILSMEDVK